MDWLIVSKDLVVDGDIEISDFRLDIRNFRTTALGSRY